MGADIPPPQAQVKIAFNRNGAPHMPDLIAGIQACGDELDFDGLWNTGIPIIVTSEPGCAAWCWQNRPKWSKTIVVCVDVHPFPMLHAHNPAYPYTTIFQISRAPDEVWGAKAEYAPRERDWEAPPLSSDYDPNGPKLILGQVRSDDKTSRGLIDSWDSPGADRWADEARKQPNTKFREHPAEFRRNHPGEHRVSLEEDLRGCSGVLSWNSTAVIHARMLGYPGESAHPQGWGNMDITALAQQEVTPEELRSGEAWQRVRTWLTNNPNKPRNRSDERP